MLLKKDIILKIIYNDKMIYNFNNAHKTFINLKN